MERKFLGPSINQIGEYLSSFVKSKDPKCKVLSEVWTDEKDSLKTPDRSFIALNQL